MRVEELGLLTIDDVRKEGENYFAVIEEREENRGWGELKTRPREVVLNWDPRMTAVFDDWLLYGRAALLRGRKEHRAFLVKRNGTPLSGRSSVSQWTAVSRAHLGELGTRPFLFHFHPHALRHSARNALTELRVAPQFIQHQFGHASLQTTLGEYGGADHRVMANHAARIREVLLG